MRATQLFSRLALPVLGLAAVHNFFVGNMREPSILHAMEFDDETMDLTEVNPIEADKNHSWIALNHDKSNLYGTSINNTHISSYKVTSPTTLEFVRGVNQTGDCFNQSGTYVQGTTWPPYTVFTASWPDPCSMAISVDEDGSLLEVLDTWTFGNGSGVHGVELVQAEDGSTIVYSADTKGNAVWTHRFDEETGTVEEIGRLDMSVEDMHPRHLIMHPNHKFLYVVLEASNEVGIINLDESLMPVTLLDNRKLIPEGFNNSQYWSSEVMLSPSNSFLWATARPKPETDITGFINSYLLSDDGEIIKQMFRAPTTGLRGIANAIKPAPWSDEFAAVAEFDMEKGYVEIWRMTGTKETELGVEYENAEAVARVDFPDGGCCANLVWM